MASLRRMIELLTTAEMAEADRLTIAGGVAGIDADGECRAGGRRRVAARHPAGTRVVVVAGPGNNGGDGFVAARLLAERGYRGPAAAGRRPCAAKGDAAAGRPALERPRPSPRRRRRLMPAEIVVDALFGAGLDRPVEGVARAMIEAINAAAARPCGRPAERHQWHHRRGHGRGGQGRGNRHVLPPQDRPSLLPGRLHCGTIGVADIGIRADVLDAHQAAVARSTSRSSGAAAFPVPRIDGHKYGRGHAVVVSGGSPRPARPGLRRAARCGRARAS